MKVACASELSFMFKEINDCESVLSLSLGVVHLSWTMQNSFCSAAFVLTITSWRQEQMAARAVHDGLTEENVFIVVVGDGVDDAHKLFARILSFSYLHRTAKTTHWKHNRCFCTMIGLRYQFLRHWVNPQTHANTIAKTNVSTRIWQMWRLHVPKQNSGMLSLCPYSMNIITSFTALSWSNIQRSLRSSC